MGYVPVGQVTATHGIKGEVKFHYYNDEKEVFYGYTSFLVKNENDRWIKLEPIEKRFYKGFFYLKLKGLDNPGAVSCLINKEFFVEEDQLSSLNEGEYYEYQLIGLNVINQHGTGIGIVSRIMRTGAHDLIVVKGKEETLIPMVEGYIVSVDIKNQNITVVKPEAD